MDDVKLWFQEGCVLGIKSGGFGILTASPCEAMATIAAAAPSVDGCSLHDR
jgi:hypothetical protein